MHRRPSRMNGTFGQAKIEEPRRIVGSMVAAQGCILSSSNMFLSTRGNVMRPRILLCIIHLS